MSQTETRTAWLVLEMKYYDLGTVADKVTSCLGQGVDVQVVALDDKHVIESIAKQKSPIVIVGATTVARTTRFRNQKQTTWHSKINSKAKKWVAALDKRLARIEGTWGGVLAVACVRSLLNDRPMIEDDWWHCTGKLHVKPRVVQKPLDLPLEEKADTIQQAAMQGIDAFVKSVVDLQQKPGSNGKLGPKAR